MQEHESSQMPFENVTSQHAFKRAPIAWLIGIILAGSVEAVAQALAGPLVNSAYRQMSGDWPSYIYVFFAIVIVWILPIIVVALLVWWVFEIGKEEGRHEKADPNKQSLMIRLLLRDVGLHRRLSEVSSEWLERKSFNMATMSEPTGYDNVLQAIEQMKILHGHADVAGLCDAWRQGKSFNEEVCYTCDGPRFQWSPKEASAKKAGDME